MGNLQRTFDHILRIWGHNVLLQRKVDGKFITALEKHTVRHTHPATRGLPRTREERPEGITNTVDLVYYFRANAAPREGDRIYDGDPSNKNTFIIDYALPLREKGGQIAFYTVGVTRESPN